MKIHDFGNSVEVKTSTCMGLDIGHANIKSVILEKKSGGFEFELKDFSIYPVTNASLVPSMIKKIFDEKKMSANNVCISVAGRSTLVRILWVPTMSPKETKLSMQYELDQYVPFPIDDVRYDSYVFNESSLTRKKDQMRIIIAVAKKELIERKMSMATEAGFDVIVIDMEALALCNAFCVFADEDKKKGTVGLIDIGAGKTIINVLSDGILTFTREIECRAKAVENGITKGLNVSEEKARDLLFSGDPQIENWVIDFAEKLSKQLWSSMEFYDRQEQSSVEKLYFTGGGCVIGKLVQVIGENISMPVEIWNPVKNYDFKGDINIEKEAPLAAIACGLALRGL